MALQRPLIIGARGSPLAQAQARMAQAALAQACGASADAFALHVVTTTGDRVRDRALADIGGKGLFTKEIEEALLDGRIDVAVHSMKDMPTRGPDGLVVAAVLPREDVRDALITADGVSLDALAHGARLGTASARRGAQLLAARPDLQVSLLRGNVDTRLAKVTEGAIDATVLAVAGLTRLGRSVPHSLLDPDAMPPAACQGAVALQVRADDAGAQALLAGVNHAQSAVCVAVERGFLTALDGSCRTAIGAWARRDGDALRFCGEALAEDGSRRWRQDGHARWADMDTDSAFAWGGAFGRAVVGEAGAALSLGA